MRGLMTSDVGLRRKQESGLEGLQQRGQTDGERERQEGKMVPAILTHPSLYFFLVTRWQGALSCRLVLCCRRFWPCDTVVFQQQCFSLCLASLFVTCKPRVTAAVFQSVSCQFICDLQATCYSSSVSVCVLPVYLRPASRVSQQQCFSLCLASLFVTCKPRVPAVKACCYAASSS